jgi:hypothetical protein
MRLLKLFGGGEKEEQSKEEPQPAANIPKPPEPDLEPSPDVQWRICEFIREARQNRDIHPVPASGKFWRKTAINELLIDADHTDSDISIFTGNTDLFPLDSEAIDRLRSHAKNHLILALIIGDAKASQWIQEIRHLPNAEIKNIAVPDHARSHVENQFFVAGKTYIHSGKTRLTYGDTETKPNVLIPARINFNDPKGADILRDVFNMYWDVYAEILNKTTTAPETQILPEAS